MQKISHEEITAINEYWRAATYLSIGQIYLLDNPLLKEPLSFHHLKPRLVGHYGTAPGINFIYAHLNRIIKNHELNAIFIAGPGHGGAAVVANSYLEGVYSKFYPEISQNEDGLRKLFKQFSFPGGIPSHASAETPGSINEGGELGYALSHAFGAVLDNKDLYAFCVIGDGEAETGPLATSWHGNKFINPLNDGTVIPILHLNGYKIANPTILSRISREELTALMIGYGYRPYFVEGHDEEQISYRMAHVLDQVIAEIKAIKQNAYQNNERPKWPMIVVKTPKGWTCPKLINGKPMEDSFRSHQVPISSIKTIDDLKLLEDWLKSYQPEQLFDENGSLKPSLKALAPSLEYCMSANLHANGGALLKDLHLPDIEPYMIDHFMPGSIVLENTEVMGKYLRDVITLNEANQNFRLFSPDELNSNRWQDVLEVTNRVWMADIYDTDENLAKTGRVIEVLSEHQCQGMLEGYLLTGRHGFFSCYEAFVHIVDSMFNQHAKWLHVTNKIPWRKPIASLNYLLSSHVWRQDHNGYSHQEPGFVDHVLAKKPDITRVYFPIDVNTLLSTTKHCLASKQYVNVIVAGKQPNFQWFNKEEALAHCRRGLSVLSFISDDNPDVVMACVGDVPTQEVIASAQILKQFIPNLKIRVINVIDIMRLLPHTRHPHGLSNDTFDEFFTIDKPVIFAYHGYPELIHRLVYERHNRNFMVHGFREEGTTTTPFDMVVSNGMDRFTLAIEALDSLGLSEYQAVKQMLLEKLDTHRAYIDEYGDDLPEIKNWSFTNSGVQFASTEDDNR